MHSAPVEVTARRSSSNPVVYVRATSSVANLKDVSPGKRSSKAKPSICHEKSERAR